MSVMEKLSHQKTLSLPPNLINQISKELGPGLLSGITCDKWVQLLNESHNAVDISLMGKGFSITISSLLNSIIAMLERGKYLRAIDDAKILPPIFILGVWRSGTTFLHNILSKDPRFAYPTRYQVRHPNTFLTFDPFMRRLSGRLSARKRIQDNVWISHDSPDEDEIALCQLSLRSPILSYIFPRRAAFYYQHYDTFENTDASDLQAWQSALVHFLSKLTVRYQRPLLLKSPDHTGRLKILAGMFPEARFILIHRNPYTVYQSTLLTHEKTVGMWSLQTEDGVDFERLILERNQRIFSKLFRDLDEVSPERICQVSFDQLEADPIHQAKQIYSRLNLSGFLEVEERMASYIKSLKNYKKNQHERLSAMQKRQVFQYWSQAFEHWGYDE